ncbi:MAG TPA: choice-of-anchor Q domain-containing protein, partial [Actinomycetota bacterium]|nr:choice-of-anchor Q domain-containing protein [Actinomycetota bacterium]
LSAQGATGGAADGGGIFNGGGPLSVISSSITTGTVHAQSGGGNASAGCGGIHQTANAHLSLVRSSVDRNHVAAGAGPDDSNAGGGGMCASGSASIVGSTVSRNTALATTADGIARARGGGLWLTSQSDDGAITNSTIANNTVTAKETGSGSIKSFGGGIDTFLSPLVLTDATVAANKVAGTGTQSFPMSGGGVFVDGSGTVTLAATILARDLAHGVGADCFGSVGSNGHNLVQKPSGFCTFAKKPSDQVNVDPKLGLLADNGGPTETMAIGATSPALDAILAAACAVAKDQRGVPRPQGPSCDIGAYERKI